MTAPWSIELQKHILVIIHHNLLVVVGNNNMNRSILRCGNRFRLHARLNLTSNNTLNEVANILLGDLLGLIIRELLILDRLLDSKGGELVCFKI